MKRWMMLAAAAAVAAGTLAPPGGMDALASGSRQGGGSGHGTERHDRDQERERHDERPEYKQPSPGQERGLRSDAEIRQKLEAEGYTIQRMERERNEVEVKAMRGGQRWELKIDPETGRVLEREREN